LIELLIVVAIIAILAAIAVPNFVQAQVRSRVSAVEMDMRSIAVGLESYRVDHNRYPEPVPPLATVTDLGGYVHIALTTPVVYLSQYMDDPFVKEAYPAGNYRGKIHFSLVAFGPISDYYEVYRGHPNPVYDSEVHPSRLWFLSSAGPDLARTFTANAGKKLVEAPYYDPTNGTPSAGEVIRTNLGTREITIQMANP